MGLEANRIVLLESIVENYEDDLEIYITDDAKVEIQDIDCTEEELDSLVAKLKEHGFTYKDKDDHIIEIFEKEKMSFLEMLAAMDAKYPRLEVSENSTMIEIGSNDLELGNYAMDALKIIIDDLQKADNSGSYQIHHVAGAFDAADIVNMADQDQELFDNDLGNSNIKWIIPMDLKLNSEEFSKNLVMVLNND